MPTYEFECRKHGRFDLIRLMRESDREGVCPACGRACRRTVTAPNLRLLAPRMRDAMDRNEKSRHAPQVRTRGCGHDHSASKAKNNSKKPKLQAYRGRRPWVIEHA